MDILESPERVAREIVQPGETVVWSASAPRGFRLRGQDAFIVPFMLLWAGFPTVAFISNIASGQPVSGGLFFIPFMLVGAYMLFGRFIVEAQLRRRTVYVVTDRAAYIARTQWLASTRRFAGSALDSIEVKPKPNGNGTILFGPGGMNAMFRGQSPLGTATLDRFDDIADARRVYGLILATQGQRAS